MSGTARLDHPISGPARSGHPVDVPISRGIRGLRSAYYRKVADYKTIISAELKEWQKKDPQLFLQDIYNVTKL